MSLGRNMIITAAFALLVSGPAVADTSPASDPSKTWECHLADGTLLYTNKERPGCRLMQLKPLSTVPSLDHMPMIPRTHDPTWHSMEVPPILEHDPLSGASSRPAPDWAREWRVSLGSSGSTYAEVCSMYQEWIQLVQKTRGGFFFGSDPSYGGDLSGRNLTSPSYSFYDNARWLALSRIFGTGFVPVGCP